jgi:hypothetical protein
MLSLIPQDEPEMPTAYAEAVSRLASVRHALRLVDGGFSAGPEGLLQPYVLVPEAARRHLAQTRRCISTFRGLREPSSLPRR